MKKPYLSCIVLTADSQDGKAGSIRHVLTALLRQDYLSFEIIIVDNGKASVKDYLDFGSLYDQRYRSNDATVKVLRPRKRLSIGRARNFGASSAQGKVLVFNDDDTIPVSEHALSIIAKASRRALYGYGARRLWTKKRRFQEKSEYYLHCIQKQKIGALLKISGLPEPGKRGGKESFLGEHSFIGNFGFCHTDIFEAVGGFAGYPEYGYEDDRLMYKLYRLSKRFFFLGELQVVHINHDIPLSPRPNLYMYLSELHQEGVYWFHPEALFSPTERSDLAVVQPLQTLHLDHRVEAAYSDYRGRKPLHLIRAGRKAFEAWIKHEQLTRVEFAQMLDLLGGVGSFDQKISLSNSDLDSLAPVIQAGLREGVLKINNKGKMEAAFKFRFTSDIQQPNCQVFKFQPNSKFNQFPCDQESRLRRFGLIKQRFPYAEFIRLALIGDDDQVSSLFAKEHWARIVIIEKDPQIVMMIKRANPTAVVLQTDVTDSRAIKKAPKVETFITDPPYTLHGALAFIIAGLELLDTNGEDKEFFVVLNPTMMGDRLDRLISTLAASRVTLVEVHGAFSSYELPKYYAEHRRARVFISTMVGFRSANRYSSSSSLYIFRTKKPDITRLRARVNPKLMYNHFV